MPTQQLPCSAVAERRSAGFRPSFWGDYFLAYASCPRTEFDDKVEEQVQELKDEVKTMLVAAASDDKPMEELLNLIDHIQRLGVGHHFDKQIDDVLKRIYGRSCESMDGASCTNGLHSTALMFRLLRQHGYRIPCDVFNKFKGPGGDFDESLKTDARGLLSLYEASHLRVHGEDVLDEAIAFTRTHLSSMKEKLSPPLRDEISRALEHCIRRNMTRIEAWHFIKFYEAAASHNEVLLKLAKLDFNMLQKIHQKELCDLTRWWKSLDAERNFPFARDRLVECYLWSSGPYEPRDARCRIISTKVIAVLSTLDDLYDVYGTREELELFTRAVERWDVEVVDELPEYMQLCYKALLNVYSDIEQMLPEEVRSYRMYYGIEAMKIQLRGYFNEAKCYYQGHIPTMEEYMLTGLDTGTILLLSTTAFLGMGDVATEEAFQWLFSNSKMLRASAAIGRLVDDIVTHEFEQQRGHSASAVECYMKQHGVTMEVAKRELWKQVDDAWKDINEGLLRPTAVPAPLLNMILHVMRMMDVIYREIDIYTFPEAEMKDIITSLFVKPLPV